MAKKQTLQHKGIFTTDDSARCALFTTREPCESGEERIRRVKKKKVRAAAESLAFLF